MAAGFDFKASASATSVVLPSGDLLGPFHPSLVNNTVASAINKVWAVRVKVPSAGTLQDLSAIRNAATGNYRIGVYDTGQATPGTRTLLYQSASTAVPTASVNSMFSLADPNLAVTAGQEVDLAIIFDTNANWIGYVATAYGGRLPADFRVTGVAPKMQWTNSAAGFALPTTIAEADCAEASSFIPLWARLA